VFGRLNKISYICGMKEKLKKYKLIGLENTSHSRLVLVGRLKQKGLAHDAYYSMGKNYYWVTRGNTV
tara:strand:+ start:128 stop:328 length:201 start_codon:yes stop_codon:yes gene_type:complete